MKKKILIVDDSALMRRVLCDIINSDNRFEVVDKATNGLEAFDLLSRNCYDAVVLDVNMPKMNGLQLLQELRKYKISAKIMMASTDTREGAQTTLDALELGAMDFIHKPERAFDCKNDNFQKEMLRILDALANSKSPVIENKLVQQQNRERVQKVVEIVSKQVVRTSSKKLVAIASSTGGPKALQSVIPNLPKNLDAPVLIVQHMPKGFTATLAERLNDMSEVEVKEAAEGDVLKPGHVYLSQGGMHMNVVQSALGVYSIHYSDEPNREGVKPCANYMYESLRNSNFDEIVCVVMTGMGADGTVGIRNLEETKKVHVIAQNQETCVVYGMPKNVIKTGLSDVVVPLDEIAQEIILKVGVH